MCSEGVSPIAILDEETIDHARHIEDILPVALKYGNDILGTHWTLQQDDPMPHVHHLSQQWCKDNFPLYKYLGYIISSKLDWGKLIKDIECKVRKRIALIESFNLFECPSPSLRKALFYSYIRPLFTWSYLLFTRRQ